MNKNEKSEESSIMFQFKNIIKEKWWIITITFAIILIGIPLVIDKLVFMNKIHSGINNGDWASFLGSFIGGIVGAIIAGIVTLLGVIFSIGYSQQQSKIDRHDREIRDLKSEIQIIAPYIRLKITNTGGGLEEGFILKNILQNGANSRDMVISVVFKNIGRNSAVNIECVLEYKSRQSKGEKKNIFYMNRNLAKEEELKELNLLINQFSDSLNKYELKIYFEDLMGNKYFQKIYIEGNGCFMEFHQVKYNSDAPVLYNSSKLEELYKRK